MHWYLDSLELVYIEVENRDVDVGFLVEPNQ